MARKAHGYVYNTKRQVFLASDLAVANTHLTRLRGLLSTPASSFHPGKGLWIIPCRGVHTLAMSYPIDVVYLNQDRTIVHVEENVRPWRFTPVRMDTESVLELPAHTLHQTGTQIGDQLEISFHDAAQPGQ